MNNKKIQTYSMNVNKSALTNQEKYTDLKGAPFTMQLVVEEGVVYTANVIFNFALDDIVLQVYNGTTLVQGNTTIGAFPTNLLLCSEMNNYGLFYFPIDSVFEFWYLDGWYNFRNGMNYWEFWDYLKQGQV